jgi:hypothetical protein
MTARGKPSPAITFAGSDHVGDNPRQQRRADVVLQKRQHEASPCPPLIVVLDVLPAGSDRPKALAAPLGKCTKGKAATFAWTPLLSTLPVKVDAFGWPNSTFAFAERRVMTAPPHHWSLAPSALRLRRSCHQDRPIRLTLALVVNVAAVA